MDLLLQLERGEEYLKTHVPVGSTFTEQYYLAKVVSETFCKSAPIVSNSTAIPGSQESLHIQNIAYSIQLPSFNSDILQWMSFRNTFKSLVHKNPSLANIENFH